jgi:predicted  nucleic acid-binding Zn-ribbon protein
VNPHILKHLEVEVRGLREERDLLEKQREKVAHQINQIQDRIRSTEKKIQSLTQNRVSMTVTEHALLRYLERVKKVNLGKMRDEILGSYNNRGVLIDGELPLETHVIKVKNGVVITVLPKGKDQDG